MKSLNQGIHGIEFHSIDNQTTQWNLVNRIDHSNFFTFRRIPANQTAPWSYENSFISHDPKFIYIIIICDDFNLNNLILDLYGVGAIICNCWQSRMFQLSPAKCNGLFENEFESLLKSMWLM